MTDHQRVGKRPASVPGVLPGAHKRFARFWTAHIGCHERARLLRGIDLNVVGDALPAAGRQQRTLHGVTAQIDEYQHVTRGSLRSCV